MTETKPGFIETVKSYPATFWVANTMEIFERMAWYGWFTVMALYVTGSVETGGLGFTTETRGMLQAVVPCILYLLPVVTGALADRYGFKRTFVVAYVMMIAAYYLLGQFHTLPGFFMAFLFVALAAATFKPVVVGTVAKVTNESNSATGFGIFYMMVNIGGFVGPIVAGVVRGWGWENVFYACSAWAVVNLLIVLTLYKEPKVEGLAKDKRTLKKVGDDLVEVLGNGRFFITTGTVIIALMVASALSSMRVSWFSWKWCGIILVGWVVLNILYDLVMPAGSGRPQKAGQPRRFFLAKRMHCSNWRFCVFLLIMSGFWTSFNQIFYTMPEYIRDFTDTRPMLRAAQSLESTTVWKWVFGEADLSNPNEGIASKMATINESERGVIVRSIGNLNEVLASDGAPSRALLKTLSQARVDEFIDLAGGPVRQAYDQELPETADGDTVTASAKSRRIDRLSDADVAAIFAVAKPTADADPDHPWVREALDQTAHHLIGTKVRVTPDRLEEIVLENSDDTQTATNRIMIECRQVNPEFIVNIDALAIIIFQVLISFLMAKFHRFTTMIVGMVIAAVGIGLSFFAGDNGMLGTGGSVVIVALGLFTFAIGEMMASPTSQEYVGRIAPRDKIALYMGYYFVAVALGNLFGGILSGQLYGKLARDMQRPDLMWLAFGGIMLFTAIVFLLYNMFALPKDQADSLTPAT